MGVGYGTGSCAAKFEERQISSLDCDCQSRGKPWSTGRAFLPQHPSHGTAARTGPRTGKVLSIVFWRTRTLAYGMAWHGVARGLLVHSRCLVRHPPRRSAFAVSIHQMLPPAHAHAHAPPSPSSSAPARAGQSLLVHPCPRLSFSVRPLVSSPRLLRVLLGGPCLPPASCSCWAVISDGGGGAAPAALAATAAAETARHQHPQHDTLRHTLSCSSPVAVPQFRRSAMPRRAAAQQCKPVQC